MGLLGACEPSVAVVSSEVLCIALLCRASEFKRGEVPIVMTGSWLVKHGPVPSSSFRYVMTDFNLEQQQLQLRLL